MMADMILSIAKDNMEMPFISLGENYQKWQVVINNTRNPNSSVSTG